MARPGRAWSSRLGRLWIRLAARVEGDPTAWVVGLFLLMKALVLLTVYALLGVPGDFLRQLSLRWDGNYYYQLARDGYEPATFPDGATKIAFAPVFPAFVRMAGAAELTPLAVSLSAGILAVGVVTRLWGPRAGLFLALWPVWMAVSSFGYTETTWVLFAAVALRAATLRRWEGWFGSGLATGVAMGTRYSGAVAFVSFLILLARSRMRSWGPYVAAVGAVVAGLAWFSWFAGGSVFAYWGSETYWGGGLRHPWAQLQWYLHGSLTNAEPWRTVSHPVNWALRNYLFVAVSAIGTVHLWVRERSTFLACFSAPVLWLALSIVGTPAVATPRLLLMGFPAIALLGRRLRGPGPWAAYAVLAFLGSCWVVVEHLTTFFF